MTKVTAYAAYEKGLEMKAYEYDLGDIGHDEVDIRVEYCGICHSDLSMLKNEWNITQYPIVPGHEVVGIIQSVGPQVKGLCVGQRVGLGWFSHSCMHCPTCLGGDHNLCPQRQGTVVGRHGGFANYVRCQGTWAIPLPDDLSTKAAGPLFCGGLTVFNPIVQFGVSPLHRVGVIGIGGLGHLALQFLNKWGCEVTAFTSSPSKIEEAKKFGAHHVLSSLDSQEMEKQAGTFDFILNTADASLDWQAYFDLLAPKGRLHTVGIVPAPIPAPTSALISNQVSLSGSPLGSPATLMQMLKFCERHDIEAKVEMFPMGEVNKALGHVDAGKAHYRVVLEA